MANLACNDCAHIFHIRDESPLRNKLQFCPACGSTDITISVKSFDYWSVLSSITDVHPEILRQLFIVWDSKEEPNFINFIQDIRRKVA